MNLVLSERLSKGDLVDLVEGRTLALRIPNYCSPTLAQELSSRLIQHPLFGHYENAADIGRVGMAFFETVGGGSEATERYYRQALPAIEALREAFAPFASPIDRLRAELQEVWTAGASFMNLDGRPMFVGLARVFENGSEALPHQDMLRRDAPSHPAAYGLITQLAANVYLQPSDEGGELEVWRQHLGESEYEQLRLPGSYGLDRTQLLLPKITLAPQAGELIVFDATRVHAVRASRGGPRVTLSCFIGYRGRCKPLSYWS